jgi:hypothetical protein
MHGLRAGAPRREFEQFVTDSADQLLRTVYLMARDGPTRSTSTQGSTPRPARRPSAFSMQHGLLPKEGLPARLLA